MVKVVAAYIYFAILITGTPLYLLNQVRARLFSRIAFVREVVCVCLCVCVSTPKAMNN